MRNLREFKPIIGIYKITCRETGRVYIGQSPNIHLRIATHANCLYNGKYKGDFQADFDKYGAVAFDWEIIRECSKKNLNRYEREEIAKYIESGLLYNINLMGASAPNPEAIIQAREMARRRVENVLGIEVANKYYNGSG